MTRAAAPGSVFRHRSFAAFWVASLASNSGTWLHIVTSTILVFSYTQSTQALGILGFAAYLPLLLFTLPAGVLTDRFDRRLIVVLSHLVGMTAAGVQAVTTAAGLESPEAIALCAFLVYTTYAIAKPATSAIFPGLVDRPEIPQATAMNSLSFLLGQLIGPVLATVCIALGVPALAFALNSASYLGVIVVVRLLPRTGPVASAGRASVTTQLAEGFSYVRTSAGVSLALLVLLVTSPLPEVMRLLAPAITAPMDPAMPGGSEGLAGLVAAAIGLGSAGGLTVSARIYAPDRLGRTIAAGMLALAAGSVSLALALDTWVAIASALVVGFGYGVAFASLTAFIQATVPDALRGRVLAIHTLVHLGTRPLFTPLAGWLAAVVGILGCVIAFVVPLVVGAVVIAGRGLAGSTRREALDVGRPPVG